MNNTRLIIPITPAGAPAALTTPHFDDETTIVTARAVVPIDRAMAPKRSRLPLLVLSTAVAASIFGALSALGVNYYENRRASATQLETKQGPDRNQPPTSEPLKVAVTVPEDPARAVAAEPELEKPQSEPVTAGKQGELSADKASTAILSAEEPSTARTSAPPPGESRNSGSGNDAGRLVRKRRVYPVVERTMRLRQRPENRPNRGAGHIGDLFGGPNPE